MPGPVTETKKPTTTVTAPTTTSSPTPTDLKDGLIDPLVSPPKPEVKDGGGGDKPKGDGKTAAFDPWTLPAPAQAKVAELKKLVADNKKDKNKDKIKALADELKKTWKVPEDWLKSIIAGQEGFGSKLWGSITSGGWDTTSVGDDGKVGTRTKISDKGLSVEGEKNRFSAGPEGDGGKVSYGHKPSGTTVDVAGGARDGGGGKGSADVGWGDKKKDGGRTSVSASGGGGDGAGEGKVIIKNETETTTTSGTGGYELKNDAHTLSGGYKKEVKDVGSTEADGKVVIKDGVTIGGSYKTTAGKESQSTSGQYVYDDKKGQHTLSGKHSTKTATGSGSVDGKLTAGKEGVGYEYNSSSESGTTKKSESVASSAGPDGSKLSVSQSVTEGDHTQSVTADYKSGKTEGAAFKVTDKKGGTSNSYGAGTETTTTDKGTTSTTQGNFEHKSDGGTKGTGDDITVKLSGKVTDRQSATGTDQSQRVDLGGSIQKGTTSANVTVGTENASTAGNNYEVTDLKADVQTGIQLDEAKKKDLVLSVGGQAHITTKPGDATTFEITAKGKVTEGEGKNKSTMEISVTGGQAAAGDVTKKVLGDKVKLGNQGTPQGNATPGQPETGGFVQGQFNFEDPRNKGSATATFGKTDDLTMGSLKGSYEHKDDKGDKQASVDMFAAMAQKDDKMAGLFSLTSDVVVANKWTFSLGGSYQLKPTDQGYDRLWAGYAGAGYSWQKGSSVWLKTGIAGDGQKIAFIPEVGLKFDNKIDLSVMGAFGKGTTPTVGGKIGLPGGISIFGGYGDMSALNKPYYGNNGMDLKNPGPADNFLGTGGPQGFIGIQADLISIGRKIFK